MPDVKIECGQDGCVAMNKSVGDKLSKNMYIVWTAIIIFTFGTAVYGVDLKCSDKVDKKEFVYFLEKINEKLDSISRDTSEIRENQKAIFQYIDDARPKSEKRDDRIRILELKDAARSNRKQ